MSSLDAVPIRELPTRQLHVLIPPSLMQHRVENHNYLKYYLLKARRVDTTLWVDEHL
jgi:hypothetical protein